jgi:hypothetical protein
MITVRPQWVMVGFPADPSLVFCGPGQVAILASTKLTQAQMEYTARSYDFASWEDFRRRFKPHHTLAVELDDFVVVVADTYAEALVLLFRDWMPNEQAAIEAASQALPQEAEVEPMTYPSTGGHGPSVPAGGRDTSDNPGPTIEAMGIVVPRAVYHDGTGYQPHRDRDESPTSVPISDPDRDDGLPDIPRYEGPTVADQAALLNPSAGNQGPAEQGMTDINPQGSPNPQPGSVPINQYDQAPGNTSKGNPSY